MLYIGAILRAARHGYELGVLYPIGAYRRHLYAARHKFYAQCARVAIQECLAGRVYSKVRKRLKRRRGAYLHYARALAHKRQCHARDRDRRAAVKVDHALRVVQRYIVPSAYLAKARRVYQHAHGWILTGQQFAQTAYSRLVAKVERQYAQRRFDLRF